MQSIDVVALNLTLLEELGAAWDTLRRAHPLERFYSFGVYTTDLVDYLTVTASTEEGLAVVTKSYVERDGGDPAVNRASLRWSPCDSPLHQECDGLLPNSERLCRSVLDVDDDPTESDAVIGVIFEAAVKALRELDRERIFGADLERAALVLGIWKGDQSDQERTEFVRQLNARGVAKRFAREISEGAEAFFKLHPS